MFLKRKKHEIDFTCESKSREDSKITSRLLTLVFADEQKKAIA